MITNILAYLEQAAARTPEKPALIGGGISLSYSSLLTRAKSLGCRISHSVHGLTKRPIAVIIDRSPMSVVAFLAVVYSGNFYVPIDISLPRVRVDMMLQKLSPVLTVSSGVPIPDFYSGAPHLSADEADESFDDNILNPIRVRQTDLDPLYAIFTSGSTGVPKAVLVSHRSVIDLAEHFTAALNINEDAVFANQAPFDFDVSVKDLYLALKNSATVHILPKQFFSVPSKLVSYLNEHRVNTLIWSTSAMRILSNLRAFSKGKPLYLKQVMFSGEVMPVKILNDWRSYLPDVRYVNLYGPTEITCNCTYYIADREYSPDEALPIGIPFVNCEVLILNSANQKASLGEQGEICVRGTCLALGYYHDPERTAAVFVQNPLNEHYQDVIYRTGDLGFFAEDGMLYYCGRRDHQVKHMGYRIELGEIERAANALGFIKSACCLYDESAQKLVLFYEAEDACEREIARALLATLPKFMLPNRMICLEQLPLNKNGKIDRILLHKTYLAKNEGEFTL